MTTNKMYRRNERKFSQYVRKALRSTFYVLPIESHGTLGIPDLYMHKKGGSLPVWLELKDMSNRQEIIGKPVTFEPGQLNRIYSLHETGAKVAVLIYHRGEAHYTCPITQIDRKTQCLLESEKCMINKERPSKWFADWLLDRLGDISTIS